MSILHHLRWRLEFGDFLILIFSKRFHNTRNSKLLILTRTFILHYSALFLKPSEKSKRISSRLVLLYRKDVLSCWQFSSLRPTISASNKAMSLSNYSLSNYFVKPIIWTYFQVFAVLILQTIRPFANDCPFNISLLNIFDFSYFISEPHNIFTSFVVLFQCYWWIHLRCWSSSRIPVQYPCVPDTTSFLSSLLLCISWTKSGTGLLQHSLC